MDYAVLCENRGRVSLDDIAIGDSDETIGVTEETRLRCRNELGMIDGHVGQALPGVGCREPDRNGDDRDSQRGAHYPVL